MRVSRDPHRPDRTTRLELIMRTSFTLVAAVLALAASAIASPAPIRICWESCNIENGVNVCQQVCEE
jgi:hypothetical protein